MWDPTRTPWCKAHWASHGGNSRATNALVGEYGLLLGVLGLKPSAETFRQLLVSDAPLCCKISAEALVRVRRYARQGPPVS